MPPERPWPKDRCQRQRNTANDRKGSTVVYVQNVSEDSAPDPDAQSDEDETDYSDDLGSVERSGVGRWLSQGPPNGSRLSCGALKKKVSFNILCAPPASSAC
jgi:hypothetical protein